jgi:hypothetical protein
MKRLILAAVVALSVPATFAYASSETSTQTIAARVASGDLTVAAVENLLSGSGLTYEDVQNMTLIEATAEVQAIIAE